MIEAALYLFPVPLSTGDPREVLPPANIELLRQVKYFVVENLRSARRFLKAVDKSIDIDTLEFTELSEHTPQSAVEGMLGPLERGEAIGVISEAGCPAVADPGADIVAAAQRRGLKVIPLVGPSSILLALMASGFNGQSFAFLGYLPVEAQKRISAIKELEKNAIRRHQTQIFIETPYRNNAFLADLIKTLSPHTLLCVASDVTGPQEKIITLTVEKWRSQKYDYAKIPTIFLVGTNS